MKEKPKFPQQKDKNREPYKKWNIKTGWVIVGYIKTDNENGTK